MNLALRLCIACLHAFARLLHYDPGILCCDTNHYFTERLPVCSRCEDAYYFRSPCTLVRSLCSISSLPLLLINVTTTCHATKFISHDDAHSVAINYLECGLSITSRVRRFTLHVFDSLVILRSRFRCFRSCDMKKLCLPPRPRM